MSTPTSESPLIAGIDRTIEIIEEQIRQAQGEQARQAAPVDEAPKETEPVGGMLPPASEAPPFPAPFPQAPPASAGQPGAHPARGRGGPPAPASNGALPVDARSLDDLEVFVSRLRQIREWLAQDTRLLPVVDQFIGQKVVESERRTNARGLQLAAITTIAGAALGWLLSSVATPLALLQRVMGH